MRTILHALLICLLVSSSILVRGGDSPLIAQSRHLYGGAASILLRAAESMPEEHYGFKPAETVRTFGQIVGHVTDAQYTFCSMALGETNPALKVENTITTKSDLVAALKGAVAYCDGAFASLTDESSIEMVRMRGSESPRLGVLSVNTVHSIEHYGNMVTYLRMKDLVPPTSDPEFMKQLMK